MSSRTRVSSFFVPCAEVLTWARMVACCARSIAARNVGSIERRGRRAFKSWLMAAETSRIEIGTVWARIIPRTTIATVPGGSLRSDVLENTESETWSAESERRGCFMSFGLNHGTLPSQNSAVALDGVPPL